MHPYWTDATPAMLALAGVFLFLGVAAFALGRCGSRTERLRLLTGTPSQRAALRLALAPVLREFLPLLDRAGHDVHAIVVVPSLSGEAGEALTAEVERLGETAAFVVRLAHRVGVTLRHPDDVAGVLAENLLFLYRNAASVTVVRQTAAAVIVHPAPPVRPAKRNALTPTARDATQNEAEETVVQFKANPLGSLASRVNWPGRCYPLRSAGKASATSANRRRWSGELRRL
jgi:hypothetical protein